MANKLNRVQRAKHSFDTEESTTVATSVLTSGGSLTTPFFFTRVSNLNLPANGGQSFINYSNSGTITANQHSGISQQCSVNVPDADAYAAEIFGSIAGTFPAGVIITPFFGQMNEGETLATALTDTIQVKKGHFLDKGVNPAGHTTLSYLDTIVVNASPLFNFVHGWNIRNTNGSDQTVYIHWARFGYRPLNNLLNYYDPVR